MIFRSPCSTLNVDKRITSRSSHMTNRFGLKIMTYGMLPRNQIACHENDNTHEWKYWHYFFSFCGSLIHIFSRYFYDGISFQGNSFNAFWVYDTIYCFLVVLIYRILNRIQWVHLLMQKKSNKKTDTREFIHTSFLHKTLREEEHATDEVPDNENTFQRPRFGIDNGIASPAKTPIGKILFHYHFFQRF